MGRDAYLAAHGEHRAGGAAGKGSGADVLAKRDEQAVDLHPVFPRQLCLERNHRGLRCRRLDVAPSVGDTVDVDVDADTRLTTGDAEDEIRALGTDPGQ